MPDRDPGLVAAHPENAAIARVAGPGARARPGEPYAIDGWELRAHPDLEERLRQLAEGPPGASVAVLRGLPVIVDRDGIVCVAAAGTSGLLLRLADGPARDAVLANGGEAQPAIGPDWVRADPWLSDVPATAGTAMLRSWVEAALASG